MYLLFLDESGKADERLFAVGGVAVKADEWLVPRGIWEDALQRSDWPLDKQLKWHGTTTGEIPPDTANAVDAALASAPIT